MAAREYMIRFRAKRQIDIRTMAIHCKVSQALLLLLENDDKAVTHPTIAERIGAKYKLTKKQIEGLKPENYRPSSPNYDPDRYKSIVDIAGYPLKGGFDDER